MMCIVHVSASSSFVNLQDVFEGLSNKTKWAKVYIVHNHELSKVRTNYLKTPYPVISSLYHM